MTEQYSNDIKELVIQRIKQMPLNIKLCFGNSNPILSQQDMINLINSDDELGKEIIQMHLNYLRSIKTAVI